MGSHLVRDDLPSNYQLFMYSDVHVGAKSFHEVAFKAMLEKARKSKNTYLVCLGDLVEGQTTDHPHYDSETVTMNKPGEQFHYFMELIEPLAEKHIGILQGNHDWRHNRTHHFTRDEVCAKLSIPYLGSRAFLTLNGVNIFLAHKGRRLPKGAKDDRQRRANQEASLKRNLERKWDSAHLLAHGDTHSLLVARPLPPNQYLVTNGQYESRIRAVDRHLMGARTEDGYHYVDPDSRWYAVTGTFRRGGFLQRVTQETLGADVWDDYSENANFDPTPIGYVEAVIKNDVISDVKEVYA